MLCLALCEECCFVFFELAACLARSSWHVVTAFGASGGSRTHDVDEGHCLLSRAFKESWKPWPVCSVLWYLCYPSCSATELPKLDMNNGPTLSGWTILLLYDSIAFQR